MMLYIWKHHLWSTIIRAFFPVSVSSSATQPAQLAPSFACLTLDSQKEATDYLLVGHCPEANEEEEATMTDIITTVLLGSARGPFCGVITVLSSAHHCICHAFTHLQHPFVFRNLFYKQQNSQLYFKPLYIHNTLSFFPLFSLINQLKYILLSCKNMPFK